MLSEPSDDDLRDLTAKEQWVVGHYPEENRDQYQALGAKLLLLQQILDENWIKKNDPEHTLKLQCLGATYGAALVQYDECLTWKITTDEYGRDLCLSDRNSSIRLFPLTMISKRVEDGEQIEIKSLFVQTLEMLDNARQDAS